MNWLGAQIHPELCSVIFFSFLSVTYIRLDGILLLSHFFCDLYHFRDLVMFLASSVTYIRLAKSCYLAIFGFCELHPFRDLVILFGFVSNLHPFRRNLVTWPFLAFVTYTLLGILSFFLDSSVTYIRGFCDLHSFGDLVILWTYS